MCITFDVKIHLVKITRLILRQTMPYQHTSSIRLNRYFIMSYFAGLPNNTFPLLEINIWGIPFTFSFNLEMQKKTVVAVEDITQSGNRKKNGGGNRRRESAPHYSRKYDSGMWHSLGLFLD